MTTHIGIDPGLNESGVVAWDGISVDWHGIVPNDDVVDRIMILAGKLDSPRIWCEMIACYGMPVGKETFETVLWIGEFRAYLRAIAPFQLVYRKDIKLELCGSARAKDANVRQALLDCCGPQGTKKAPGPLHGIRSHEWSALAVAEYGRRIGGEN